MISHPGSSDIANLTVSNVSLSTPTINPPNITMEVNESSTGIIIGTESFGFTSDGSHPSNFGNPHDDNFLDGLISPWWKLVNHDGSNIEETGSGLEVSSTYFQDWGVSNDGSLLANAPAVFQSVVQDFSIAAELVLSDVIGRDRSAGLLLRWDENFCKFFYKDDAVRLALGQDGNFKTIKVERIGPLTIGWLKIVRKGNFFDFMLSIDGIDYSLLMNRLLGAPESLDVGLFSGKGATLITNSWDISPDIACSGMINTTSTSVETVEIREVPFRSWNHSLNKIVIRVENQDGLLQGNPVNLSMNAADRVLNYSGFKQLSQLNTGISAQIHLRDSSMLEFEPGTESFFLADSFVHQAPQAPMFINPHDDCFSSNDLHPSWSIVNENHLEITHGDGYITLQDNGSSSMTFNDSNAPALCQDIKGAFNITATFLNWSHILPGQEYGVILLQDGDLVQKIFLSNTSGTLVATCQARTNLGSIISSDQVVNKTVMGGSALVFSLEKNCNTTRVYFMNENGSCKQEIGTFKIPAESMYQVGLYTANSSIAVVDTWHITPSITCKNDSIENATILTMRGLVIPSSFMKSFSIMFKGETRNGTASTSNFYRLIVEDPSWAGKALLFTYGVETTILSPLGTVLFSKMAQHQLDLEYIDSGNTVVVEGTVNSGKISEYDANGTLVKTITKAAGKSFNWPHDVDILEGGNWLITDTGNNRVVEISPNGSVAWEWHVWDYFSWDFLPGSSSHVNDADRLPNGNTLISIRNLDTIVEVNPLGDIVWMHGGDFGMGNLVRPHNPDRLPNGNTIICDSESSRIVEVDFEGSITWSYFPQAGIDQPMGWVRDADMHLGNIIVIGDGKTELGTKSRVFTIDRETGDITWELETPNPIYDVDIINIIEPEAIILSPGNHSLEASPVVPIVLDTTQPGSDLAYRMHDDTTGTWIHPSPVSYTQPTWETVENGHQYTLHAWASTRDVYLGHDSSRLVQSNATTLSFTMDFTSSLDAMNDTNYNMILCKKDQPNAYLTSSSGKVIEEIKVLPWGSHLLKHVNITDIESIPDGRIIVSATIEFMNGTKLTGIFEKKPSSSLIQTLLSAPVEGGIHGFVDVDFVAREDAFMISSTITNSILKLMHDGSVIEFWNVSRYNAFHGTSVNFSNQNALGDIAMLTDGTTLLTIPMDDSIVMINPAGDIFWNLNASLNGTAMHAPRSATKLGNGTILLVNGTGNLLLVDDLDGSIRWSSQDKSDLNESSISGAQMLPNGRILVSSGENGTWIIQEAYFNGTIIHSLDIGETLTTFDPVYHYSPLVFPSIMNGSAVKEDDVVDIAVFNQLAHLGMDLSWRVYSFNESDWILNSSFKEFTSPHPHEFPLPLPEGEYQLELWLNGTVPLVLSNGSDLANFYENIPDCPGSFTFSITENIPSSISAPHLIQGIISKHSLATGILSWTGITGADNYTIYAYPTHISEINSSLLTVGSSNDTWFYVSDSKTLGWYHVVIAENGITSSPPSNNVLLSSSSSNFKFGWLVVIFSIIGVVVILIVMQYKYPEKIRKILFAFKRRKNSPGTLPNGRKDSD